VSAQGCVEAPAPVLAPPPDPMLACGSRVSASRAFPDPGGLVDARMQRSAYLCGTMTDGKARKSGRLPEKVPGSLWKPFHTGMLYVDFAKFTFHALG
jgi:hypothetical protein